MSLVIKNNLMKARPIQFNNRLFCFKWMKNRLAYNLLNRIHFFCNTPKFGDNSFFFRNDIITHNILSVKGQLDGNKAGCRQKILQSFFTHILFVDNKTEQKLDGDLINERAELRPSIRHKHYCLKVFFSFFKKLIRLFCKEWCFKLFIRYSKYFYISNIS